MKRMIVDVGSNTVKYDVFSVKGGVFSRYSRASRAVRLIGYIENGVLSDEGLDSLCAVLSEYRNTAKELGCGSFDVFATASLRRLKDPAPVLSEIEKRTGIGVVLLSGEEEAACSFEGMLLTLQDKPACGVMLDMGGGSTELNFFEGERSVYLYSCPFGALSLRNAFGVERTMTGNQESSLRTLVSSVLPTQALEFRGKVETAILVGGTAKACARLTKALLGKETRQGVSVKEFEELLAILRAPDDDRYETIRALCPDRYALMSSGCAAFDEVFTRLATARVVFCGGGIREGYLQRICGKKLSYKEN